MRINETTASMLPRQKITDAHIHQLYRLIALQYRKIKKTEIIGEKRKRLIRLGSAKSKRCVKG